MLRERSELMKCTNRGEKSSHRNSNPERINCSLDYLTPLLVPKRRGDLVSSRLKSCLTEVFLNGEENSRVDDLDMNENVAKVSLRNKAGDYDVKKEVKHFRGGHNEYQKRGVFLVAGLLVWILLHSVTEITIINYMS